MFEIYILKFPNNKVYIGKTRDLHRRLLQHRRALEKAEKGWYVDAGQFDWADVQVMHFEVKNSLNLSLIEKRLIQNTAPELLYNTVFKTKLL